MRICQTPRRPLCRPMQEMRIGRIPGRVMFVIDRRAPSNAHFVLLHAVICALCNVTNVLVCSARFAVRSSILRPEFDFCSFFVSSKALSSSVELSDGLHSTDGFCISCFISICLIFFFLRIFCRFQNEFWRGGWFLIFFVGDVLLAP
jgi:hypothetical protein